MDLEFGVVVLRKETGYPAMVLGLVDKAFEMDCAITPTDWDDEAIFPEGGVAYIYIGGPWIGAVDGSVMADFELQFTTKED